MANPFTEVASALLKAGSFLLGLGAKAEKVFAAGKSLAPEAAKATITLFGDVESFIALASSSVGAEGLNFGADSAAYAAFLKVVADAKVFVAVAEADVKALA